MDTITSMACVAHKHLRRKKAIVADAKSSRSNQVTIIPNLATITHYNLAIIKYLDAAIPTSRETISKFKRLFAPNNDRPTDELGALKNNLVHMNEYPIRAISEIEYCSTSRTMLTLFLQIDNHYLVPGRFAQTR